MENLRMNVGLGQGSYANNSLLQKNVATKTMPIVGKSAEEVYLALKPKCFMMADMGCSSGPNVFLVVSKIIDVIDEACQSLNCQAPEFGMYLNDLPGNDYNTLFSFLPNFCKWVEEEKGSDFGPYFVSGAPKSFYGRVFPNQCLHFVHSCYALHWTSQVPEELASDNGVTFNKDNICIAKTSPPEVHKAYYTQFKKDFTFFLRSRAREVVAHGRMVLTFNGSSNSSDPNSILELLGSTLHDMALEGVIETEKLEKFNLPFYAANAEEVAELVEAEGSFVLNKLETFIVDWSVDKTQTIKKRAKLVSGTLRAVSESLLADAFGNEVMDDLYLRFHNRVMEHLATQTGEYVNLMVSLTKKLNSE